MDRYCGLKIRIMLKNESRKERDQEKTEQNNLLNSFAFLFVNRKLFSNKQDKLHFFQQTLFPNNLKQFSANFTKFFT